MLICPVCLQKLNKTDSTFRCANGHAYDTAKEGYVNLLTGKHKSGSLIGDNKDMAKSRRAFLEKGYYDFLALKIAEMIKGRNNALDISCGEGYYTNLIAEKSGVQVWGFDISKEMIKPAAKKYKNNFFFVANIAAIPLESNSIDAAFQICAPFNEKEFARILKKDGILLSVVPAKRHLWELKELIYDTPYENNEDKTDYEGLSLVSSEVVSSRSVVDSNDDIMRLFSMTPYYYRTSQKDIEKLGNVGSLEIGFEFIIRTFVKK